MKEWIGKHMNECMNKWMKIWTFYSKDIMLFDKDKTTKMDVGWNDRYTQKGV